ncbi:MAG: energy transducer TonB [Ignavibacteria bacterium]|jgi:hypothetical protein
MKHYLNHTNILFVVFALIVHSLPTVVISQELKSLDISKNRVVLNKVLPSSPSNMDRTVKIPMSFTVLPDGTVGEVIPLSKGDPSLEANSIKTLKKWKFNPIEDNVIMKGEITFTFSPEGGGDNYTAKENPLPLTKNKLEDSMKEKYYSVNHHHWGGFMNSHAVWIDEGTLSHEGKLYKMTFSTENLEKGIYYYEYSADDSEEVYFDGDILKNFIDINNSEKGKLYLHEGIHKIQTAIRNSAINKQFWRDNPAGFAFTLTNERGKIVFSTRDEKHCYKKPNTPKFYPVSHPVWNDLLQRHAVWINNKENNHEGEYKDLTFETTIPKSRFYNFEISADDTAEFLLDGNKIMDISYQKGIHDFKIKLEEGVHQLQMKVMNFTLNKTKWEENAVGAAILVKDDSGNIVFSTRDEKYCYDIHIPSITDEVGKIDKINAAIQEIQNKEKKSRPVTYPMNKGNSHIQNHGVWVNNYGSLHINEPVEIEWDIFVPNTARYHITTSVDDEAELYINNHYIMKIYGHDQLNNISMIFDKGIYTVKVKIINRPWGDNSWQVNPGGIAMIIKDELGKTIFNTREYAINPSVQGNKVPDVDNAKIVEKYIQDNVPNNINSGSISDQFMHYLTRTEWIVTEYEPSFAKAYYGAKCKFTKSSFSYVPRYKGVYLDEIKYKIDIIGVQENFPEGSKYSGAFNFHNLQQRNDTQQHAFVYLKEDVVLWKSGFRGYTVNLVLTRAR